MEDSDISEMLDEWNVDFKDKGSGKGELSVDTCVFKSFLDRLSAKFERIVKRSCLYTQER
jgi:hypothetical protein